MRLQDKVAIVTGAGSGIGKATALLFAREGAQVIGNIYLPEDAVPLEKAAAGLPGAVTAVRADVSKDEEAANLIRTAVDLYGGVDILVNNAGVEVSGDVTATSEEDWQHVLDVNLKGVFLCSKHAVPEMLKRGRGSIVNTASINAIRGNHRLVAYSASKGGVAAITRAMALDYAPNNIRVNCVCPATIDGTRMVEAHKAAEPDAKQVEKYWLAKHPMGRLGRPEEVANAILFLAGDEASFITGVLLPIDGGRSIR